jgi:hypothetical protein
MADRYWVAGGTGNYNSTTNWSATSGGASGASVPSTVDDVFFNVLSGVGIAIITSGANCRSLNLTGFTGTLQFDNALTLNTGSIFNLGTGGYTQTGAIGVNVVGTSLAITSNGTVWSKRLFIGNNGITVTMNDTLTITGEFNFSSGAIINGFTINISGNFTTAGGGAISGTTSFVFNGNTTWSSSIGGEELRKNVTINTVGTITMSGIMAITGGTFTYIAGTVNTTAFTLKIGNNATTFNCSGIIWENVSGFVTSSTITFTSNFNVKNFLLSVTLAFNSNSINISGNLTVNNAITTSGTSVFVLNGTGTWSHSNASTFIANPLTINTVGIITLGTNVTFGGSTLTYTAGTIINTGSTLTLSSTSAMTINTSGMTWNNITLASNSNYTTTLSSNLNIGGNLIFASGGTATITFNTNTIFIGGNFSITGNSTLTGTSLIVFNGTGTWSNPGAGILKNNTTVNTTGTLTISGNVYYNTGTLTYTAGTVITTGSTLNIGVATTLNTNGIIWNNISTTTGVVITLGSNLTLTGTLSLGNGVTSFTLGGFNLISTNANLNMLATNAIFTLPANQTFKTLTITGTATINANTLTIIENLTINNTVSGTTSIIYGGTGTWSALNSSCLISNPLTINTAGTLTISGIVYKQSGLFTYTAGTIIDTTGTVAVQSITLNLSGFTFRKLLVNNTITLSSNINATTFGTWGANAITFTLAGNTLNFTHLELGNSGTTTLPTAWVCQNIEFTNVSAGILNTNSITINGNILQSSVGIYSGTTFFTYAGTGSWSRTSTGYFTNSFVINTAGILTFNGGNIGGGIFTYTAGTVITTGSTLYIRIGGTTMNDGILVWDNVTFGSPLGGSVSVASITLNNQLVCLGTLSFSISDTTFSGTDGTFDTYNLLLGIDSASRITTLVSTKTYRVRQSLICTQPTNVARLTVKSSIAGSRAILTLDAGATIDVGFVNATDIDSSLGRPIYSYKGVFSNTLNWNVLPTDVTPKVNTFAN